MPSFMRPGFVTAPSARAHVELYNPPGSGRLVSLDRLWVSGCRGYTILGRCGPALDNASFPESRGLSVLITCGTPTYSMAHVRTKDGAVVEGGQLFVWEDYPLSQHVEFPVTIGEGTGLLVRANYDFDPLYAAFLWHEV